MDLEPTCRKTSHPGAGSRVSGRQRACGFQPRVPRGHRSTRGLRPRRRPRRRQGHLPHQRRRRGHPVRVRRCRAGDLRALPGPGARGPGRPVPVRHPRLPRRQRVAQRRAGSEYVNHRAAALLAKLHAEFAKSRPRHSNDNASSRARTPVSCASGSAMPTSGCDIGKLCKGIGKVVGLIPGTGRVVDSGGKWVRGLFRSNTDIGDVAQGIGGGHAFRKHARDLGFETPEEMAEHVERVMRNPTATRSLQRGRTAYWDDATKSVVIHDPSHLDGGTVFLPNDGREYFDITLE